MVRTISITQVKDDQEARLLREGWRKQTTLGEPRLSEVVANYESLGYEVCVLSTGVAGDGCNTCFVAGEAMGQIHGTIYVRAGDTAAKDDELF